MQNDPGIFGPMEVDDQVWDHSNVCRSKDDHLHRLAGKWQIPVWSQKIQVSHRQT